MKPFKTHSIVQEKIYTNRIALILIYTLQNYKNILSHLQTFLPAKFTIYINVLLLFLLLKL